MSTTMATLAGIQEELIANTTALFKTSSELMNAVYTQSTGNATSVRFPVRSLPTVAQAQETENSEIEPTVITLLGVDAVLQAVPIIARVSKLSIVAPNAPMEIATTLSGSIASAIDTAINSVAFTGSIGADDTTATMANFFRGIGTLSATGYKGQKVAVLHPLSAIDMGLDVLGKGDTNQKSAEFLGTGYIGSIGGVQIYVSNEVPVVSGVAQNKMFFKYAIGMGYREPVIEIESAINIGTNSVDIGASSYFKVAKLINAAGLTFKAKIS